MAEVSTLSALNLNATVLPMVVRVARLSIGEVPAIFHSLLKLMFFTGAPHDDGRFIQCSVVSECVSLVVSAAELSCFPPDILEEFPALVGLVERATARPAFQAALAGWAGLAASLR